MNWEVAGAIGEIAGAFAVVLSLVYLARQVRMSNSLARAEAYREPNSGLNSINTTFGLDPKFRIALRKVIAGAGRNELDEDEQGIVDSYMISVTNIYERLSREVRERILVTIFLITRKLLDSTTLFPLVNIKRIALS